MDMKKRQRAKKVNKVDEFGVVDSLSLEARLTLQNLATEFIQSCFNRAFFSVLRLPGVLTREKLSFPGF